MNAERVLKDVQEARAYAAFLQSTRGYAVTAIDKVCDHCEKLIERERLCLLAQHALTARTLAAEARVAELEAGLREAIKFVRPSAAQLLKEFSDIDGTDAVTARQCEETRDKHRRIAELLDPQPPEESRQ